VATDKRRRKRQKPWNKGVETGPRLPLTQSEVKRIRRLLGKRGSSGLRDLALFSTAIDTMLHTSDLLSLTVKDVRQRNRVMRDTIKVTTTARGTVVRCTLSEETQGILEEWIESTGKKPGDYLFTPRGQQRSKPLTSRQMSRVMKTWVAGIGLDPAKYGTESLRRTRATYILKKTGNLEAVRALLGHTDAGSTARYLGTVSQPDPIAISRAHEI
jgi:integrase